MKVEVKEASIDQKPILANLLELYQYDMAEFSNTGWRNIGKDGKYGYKYTDEYWIDSTRTPFLVMVDENLAGFVLVNENVNLPKPTRAKSIAEFFIMRKYRKQGVGKISAFKVFDKFSGFWEVAQDKKNPKAQKFWKTIVNEYTKGHFDRSYIDNEHWNGPVLSFESRL